MTILKTHEHSRSTVITTAVETLRAGGLIIFPTETTYGLGADATNPAAIEKLLDYKSKRLGKALSIAVTDEVMASEYVELNDTARKAYQTFLPGPVTVVSVGKHAVAPGVESETGTLGVRIPDYELVREIVAELGHPITATSANASNQKRPYAVQDIFDNISDRQKDLLDLVLDAGQLPPNEPSTVIDTTLDTYSVVRQGTVRFLESETLISHSEQETRELGRKLVRRFKNTISVRPLLFALEGEMGAGKTQVVKGIAAELGISETITSPTYTLLLEYPFIAEGQNLKLIHIDAWRMESAQELQSLGLDEHLQNNSVIALEWANTQPEELQKLARNATLVWLKLSYGKAVDDREITVSDTPAEGRA